MLILVLAANTSFADFPRLASFHAHDHFLPTPLTKRGRRLVFANGIIVLAALATLLTVAFGAERARTSSRSTRSACSPRSRCRRVAWRSATSPSRSRAGSGVCGSTAWVRSRPASSAIVIAVTKFTHGAWIIMIVVPVTVAVLVRVNKHYDHVAAEARRARSGARRSRTRNRLAAVVLVSRVDDGLDRAMRYVDHLDADRVRAVHVGPEDRNLGAAFWARYGCKLEFVTSQRGLVQARRARSCRASGPSTPTTSARSWCPRPSRMHGCRHVLRHNDALRLKAGLLFETRHRGGEPAHAASRTPRLLTRAPRRHVALVPVATLHEGALRGVAGRRAPRGPTGCGRCTSPSCPRTPRSSRSSGPEQKLPVPLDVVAAPYRELGEPLLQEVEAIKAEGADLVTVVIGEFVPKWWQHGLHNHRALQMKARLLFEPGVAVVSVPHHV